MTGYRKDSYTERALELLEKDICYFATLHNGQYGMDFDDIAQEMRIHLWRKLDRYHPGKAGLRTWANRVMRMRLIDLSRRRKELLDHEDRDHYPDLGDKERSTDWQLEEFLAVSVSEIVY